MGALVKEDGYGLQEMTVVLKVTKLVTRTLR